MTSYTVELRNALDAPDIEPDLIWTDIPFNTGMTQSAPAGAYWDADPETVLSALNVWSHLLRPTGVLIVCCDYRMAPHVVTRLPHMTYAGEIIWEFGLGRPRTNWWPVRHNNLLTFHNGTTPPSFHREAVPRTKRLSAKPGYPADKPIGSVWEFTLNNTHPQRVGYPNQKPLEIIEPFILAHTRPGDLVADPFCGSATTGVAAVRHGRRFYGCDTNADAVYVSSQRINRELSA